MQSDDVSAAGGHANRLIAALVGALAGVQYVGLLGLLIGPLAIAYLFELVRFYREEYGTPTTLVSG